MSRAAIAILAFLSCAALAAPLAGAHAPEFSEGHESLSDARDIPDPTKSWAIYASLHSGEGVQYYRLELAEGDDVPVTLTIPRGDADKGFQPSIIIMGPGIEDQGEVPEGMERPNGSGAMVVEGEMPERMTYEPFSPSAFYEVATASINATVSGIYYLAVFDDGTGGGYGLAVGQRESFTAVEWLLIPFDQVSIYLWEGQPLWLVLAPAAAVLAVGLGAMAVDHRRRLFGPDALWAIGTLGGLLMVASGSVLLFQTFWALSQTGWEAAALLTLMFAIIALVLGMGGIRIARRDRTMGGVGARTRLSLAVIGALGLLLWAGWVIGPLMILIASVLPKRLLMRRSVHK